jgi:type IV secretory pathway VirB10-like protein
VIPWLRAVAIAALTVGCGAPQVTTAHRAPASDDAPREPFVATAEAALSEEPPEPETEAEPPEPLADASAPPDPPAPAPEAAPGGAAPGAEPSAESTTPRERRRRERHERHAVVLLDENRGGNDIDSLLNNATNGNNGHSSSSSQSGSNTPPDTPSRQSMVEAMHAIAPRVRECGSEPLVAQVRVTFRGNGQVADVAVQGVEDPVVRACVARTARQMRVPRFSRPTFPVTLPLRVGP